MSWRDLLAILLGGKGPVLVPVPKDSNQSTR